jgi:hypothetical protein
MAKVTAPLLSMDASGQIAKTQVYASWKGVKYARQYVIPSNPQSAEQTQTRNCFYFGTQMWKLLPANVQAAWTSAAKGMAMTNRNLFLQSLVKTSRDAATLAAAFMSPGNGGGLAPAAIAGAVDVLAVTITLTAPTLPVGWAITKAIAVGIKQQNPSTGEVYNSYGGEDDTSAHAPVITFTAAEEQDIFGFFQFSKPDGSLVYGPSLYITKTTT